MPKDLSKPELFDDFLFELNKSMLNEKDPYTTFADVRTLLTHLHERNLKLEARIAELEKQMYAPISIEQMIKDDFEVVFSGKPVDELSESQKELRKLLLKTWVTAKPSTELVAAGYVPDDFRG